MSLVRNSFIIFGLIAIVSSCAQVGRISGGERDNRAPQVIWEKSSPNYSTEFEPKKLEFTFDEHFRLNTPSTGIFIVPDHADIKVTTKGKKLLLELNGELKENTTYAVYFKNAIQDITEKNDSIFQYVFSTGETLDSLSYTGRIIDAKTNNTIHSATVKLTNLDQPELVRFASSSKDGSFTFDYLSEGNYSVLAFNDLNFDGEVQTNEKLAFGKENYQINGRITDSVPFRMFLENPIAEVSSVTRISDYLIALKCAVPCNKSLNLSLENTATTISTSYLLGEDSVHLLLNDSLSVGNLIFNCEQFLDTVSLNSRFKSEKTFPLYLANKTGNLIQGDSLKIYVGDNIEELVESPIIVRNLNGEKDTVLHVFKKSKEYLFLETDSLLGGDYIINFKEGVVKTVHGSNSQRKISFHVFENQKLGSLLVKLEEYDSPLVLVVSRENEELRTIPCVECSEIQLDELIPGNYTFKLVIDKNRNGQWDTGNLFERIQPEEIINFSKPVKVRPGWESEVELKR